MIARRACCLALLALTVLAEPLSAYWGYVPIRPTNTIHCYCEPEVYKHPGLIREAKGAFIGTENLSELPDNIRIEVEVVTPPRERVVLCKDDIQQVLEFELKTVGIKTKAPVVEPEDQYRPWLHLLLFITPVDCGYVCHMSLRLFERDEEMSRGKKGNKREHSVWQVITWEKQAFFKPEIGDLRNSLRCYTQKLADQFTRRYVHERLEDQVRDGTYKSSHRQSCGCDTGCCRR